MSDFQTSEKGENVGFLDGLITLIAVLSACFALYTGAFGERVELIQRGVHLAFVLSLIFLLTSRRRGISGKTIGFILAVLGGASGIYLVANYDAIMIREGQLTPFETVYGMVILVVMLEATRRMVGMTLPVIAILALGYAYLGPYLPFGLDHRGYTLERIASHLYLSTDGLYGIPLGVSATFIFMFVLLGAFLNRSGAGVFLADLALSLTGRARGGPAKVAVVSSAFFGTISGSAIANASATGTFTIPLMKRIGYRSSFAASIESLSSLGGQLMPPIMGSAAFVMIEFTEISYLKIAGAALIPGLLFFFTVFVIVDLEAAKNGLTGMAKEDLPKFREVIKDGWILVIPLVVLFVLLYLGFSIFMAAFWTIPSVVGVTLLRESTRLSPKEIMLALKDGGLAILGIAAACACAGIIVGVATLTGLAVQLSTLMINFSGGSLLLLLLITMVVSIILGMGLPTVACYILLAILVAPALEQMGVPLLAAHLFIFYFGIVSGITPPVALVTYAAAGIAKADPIEASWIACRLGIVIYILPFIFVYDSPILGIGAWWEIALTTAAAFFGCALLATAIQGYLRGALVRIRTCAFRRHRRRTDLPILYRERSGRRGTGMRAARLPYQAPCKRERGGCRARNTNDHHKKQISCPRFHQARR